jgi:hypothetical protein
MTTGSVTEKKTRSQCDNCMEWVSCIGLILATAVILCLTGGYIAYIVYGITFLVEDYGIRRQCADSSLWEYVLLGVILAFTRIRNVKSAKEAYENEGSLLATVVCTVFIEGGLAIWGSIELYQNSCPELKDTSLWTFGQVTFGLQVTCVAISFVLPCSVICLACVENYKGASKTLQTQNDIVTAMEKLDV